MKVAVMTLLRDRIDYTKHCYESLRENAGIDFDWFVVDQGSRDGTLAWLAKQEGQVITLPENVGICPALNMLLNGPLHTEDYDVVVRWDNDGEVLTPGTLKAVAEAADAHGWILAPKVLGLCSPPPPPEHDFLGDYQVAETSHLGGIFMAIPADLFTDWGYRYDEGFPPYTGDEAICSWWRAQGGRCGYLTDFEVNHYERVVEQREALPEYQHRKELEIKGIFTTGLVGLLTSIGFGTAVAAMEMAA